MKFLRTLGLLLITSSTVWSMALETTTSSRSTSPPVEHHPIKENDQKTSNPVMDILDVRTPPKVKQELKLKQKEHTESYHAGIAIPIDDDSIVLEETTKKLNFYKIERPTTTTNNGLSTWILLSNTPSTPVTRKTTLKPEIIKNQVNQTLVLTDKPNRIVKPVFKKRTTTTTAKPVTTTKLTTTSSSSSSSVKPTKLTKVKASVLNSAANKKNVTTVKKNNTTTTVKPILVSTTKIETSSVEINATSSNNDSASLPAEAKETEAELPTDEKKKTKKKKNKNRRRKPSADKQNKESNTKLKEVEPVSTQLYSYLRSEIIPVTVGVSLVGLLVTAGLASYYLQPFGLLTRRNDPIDRKDNEGGYYYQDQYSGGIPEEDAIGKVIAGMPENALTNDNYKAPTTKNSYPNNVRYRHVDRRSQIYMNPYGTVEDVKPNYEGKQYVVGSISKEVIQEVTPAAVPEHGPRNINDSQRKFVVGNIPKEYFKTGPSPRKLKIRRRRQVPDDSENEISTDDLSDGKVESPTISNSEPTMDVTTTTTTSRPDLDSFKHPFVDLFAELFRIKLQFGLELVQNITRGVSTYISEVETKLSQFNTTSEKPNEVLHIRKRRHSPDTRENEIFPEDNAIAHYPKIEPFSNEDTAHASESSEQSTKTPSTPQTSEGETTSESPSETAEPSNNIMHISEKPTTLMDLLKDLFRLKLRVGLELIQKVSRSVSSYVSSVQSRINHYRDDTKPRR